MTGYPNVRRSFYAALNSKKNFPNMSAWCLQCYLDPEVAIYFEQGLLVDKFIPLIKNGGNLKVKGEKLLMTELYWDQLLNKLTSWK